MKTVGSHLATWLPEKGQFRRQLIPFGKFLLALIGVVLLFGWLFHVIMAWEGQDHTWFTGVYWALTVMSTLGFGDITFHSDLGRAFSVVVLLITLESIRRTHLQERYALLWVGTGIVILVCVLFPRAVVLLRMLTGMRYTQALTAVTFTFLVLVAFHFSISISSSRSNQARIAQRLAILEERLRNLESRGGREAGDGGPQAGKETTDG